MCMIPVRVLPRYFEERDQVIRCQEFIWSYADAFVTFEKLYFVKAHKLIKSLWGMLVNVKYPLPTLKRWNVMHHIPWSHRWDAAF